jgi:hypothetical protein
MNKPLLAAALLLLPFAGQAQLQNLNFEDWVSPFTSFTNKPTGWNIHYDGRVDEPTTLFNCYNAPDTAAQSGNYALKLSIWYDYTKDVAFQVAPINYSPTALEGYYTYTDNVIVPPTSNEEIPDVAQVSVLLTKWNTSLQKKDTIGMGLLDLNGTATYTKFSVNINYFSPITPDTIRVLLDPSLLRRDSNLSFFSPNNTASYFTVDNLSLKNTNGPATSITETAAAISAKVFPNPATDQLHINGFSGQGSLFDINGRQVLDTRSLNQNSTFSLAGLPTGLYVLHLSNESRTQRIKVAKQ